MRRHTFLYSGSWVENEYTYVTVTGWAVSLQGNEVNPISFTWLAWLWQFDMLYCYDRDN